MTRAARVSLVLTAALLSVVAIPIVVVILVYYHQDVALITSIAAVVIAAFSTAIYWRAARPEYRAAQEYERTLRERERTLLQREGLLLERQYILRNLEKNLVRDLEWDLPQSSKERLLRGFESNHPRSREEYLLLERAYLLQERERLLQERERLLQERERVSLVESPTELRLLRELTAIEREAQALLGETPHTSVIRLRSRLQELGVWSENDVYDFDAALRIRNKVAHGDELNRVSVTEAVDTMQRLRRKLETSRPLPPVGPASDA